MVGNVQMCKKLDLLVNFQNDTVIFFLNFCNPSSKKLWKVLPIFYTIKAYLE